MVTCLCSLSPFPGSFHLRGGQVLIRVLTAVELLVGSLLVLQAPLFLYIGYQPYLMIAVLSALLSCLFTFGYYVASNWTRVWPCNLLLFPEDLFVPV